MPSMKSGKISSGTERTGIRPELQLLHLLNGSFVTQAISVAASATLILLAARSCNTLIRSISVRLIAITVIGPNSPTKTVESDISIWANGDFSI